MSDLFGKTELLSKTASFYLERTKVIQSNIANADTPGFKPKDLVFEKILDEQIELKKSDPKHMDPKNDMRFEKRLVSEGKYQGYDENRVDIQKEMAKLAESSIMYKSLVEAMKKEFSKLKLSISGR